jgi:formate dehydrogenase subunit delta
MANSELDHLIKMINQIADNVAHSMGHSTGHSMGHSMGHSSDHSSDHSEASNNIGIKTAEHVNRFWARSMKDQIIQYARDDGQQLCPGAREAIDVLK